MTSAQIVEKMIGCISQDLSCDPSAFETDGITVVRNDPAVKANRYKVVDGKKPFQIATFGQGVVISVHEDYFSWCKQTLEPMGKVDLFSHTGMTAIGQYLGQGLFGPNLKYLPLKGYIPAPAPQGMTLRAYNKGTLDQLYQHEGHGFALLYTHTAPYQDVLAVAAFCGDQLAGVAGASNDYADFWQIGIETQPEFRQRGLARYLVQQITQAIIDAGKIPYYTTGAHNIASQRIALSCGYWPAWTEYYKI